MDIATGLGLLAGAAVLAALIMLGGDLRIFADLHAFIVIFGGSFAAMLIGRSMIPDGDKEPNERTRQLIQKMAPALKAMPYRISIIGHTAASKVPPKSGYGAWELSADRANAVREIIAGERVPSGHIYLVAGKADTDPLFPDNSNMSPNRQVTITLVKEAPPVPANFTP